MAELLVPDSDVAAGGWTTNAGGTTNLFQGIDETGTVNLADYVQSALSPVNDTYEFTFSNPSAILTSGVINLQIGKKNNNSVVVNLKFQLLQGTTLIREQLFSDIPFTPALQQVTLTAPEIAAITDATLLRGKLIANPSVATFAWEYGNAKTVAKGGTGGSIDFTAVALGTADATRQVLFGLPIEIPGVPGWDVTAVTVDPAGANISATKLVGFAPDTDKGCAVSWWKADVPTSAIAGTSALVRVTLVGGAIAYACSLFSISMRGAGAMADSEVSAYGVGVTFTVAPTITAGQTAFCVCFAHDAPPHAFTNATELGNDYGSGFGSVAYNSTPGTPTITNGITGAMVAVVFGP